MIYALGVKNLIIGCGSMMMTHGTPLSIQIDLCKREGFDISPLHFADELLKGGFNPTNVIRKIQEETVDAGVSWPMDLIRKFVFSGYEEQRAILFEYLYGNEDKARSFFNGMIKELSK